MFPWSDDSRPRLRRLSRKVDERRENILASWNEEVCSGEELPEVEIISLLEEQIPRYKLRADTLTQFAGYENEDWFIPAPALKSEEQNIPLSPDQIRETLNYFNADDISEVCMNSNLPVHQEDIEWIDSKDDNGGSCHSEQSENSSSKLLIRQDSIHDLSGKILIRQNSLHDAEKQSSLVSNDRSLSWDNYMETYSKGSEEILQELREIREQLRTEDYSFDDEIRRETGYDSEPSFNKHHNLTPERCGNFKPNLSQSSSKNTQYSGDVSDFSFEHWNSKQSLSLETYQSHQRNRGTLEATSSGITSLSEDTSDSCRRTSSASTHSSHRNQGFVAKSDSSEDPYEYDDEIGLNLTSKLPSVDEDLIAKVLCSERVSQMSKTYNDIEAVSRLLEEKEKDLELTARIGKELLSHNNKLESNVATLEAELKAANDKIEQITHELAKKTELIQVLTNDTDESGSEAGTPTALKCINVEFMQRRIKALEDENKTLRKEFAQLAKDAESVEEKEQRLVHDITLQLANANVEVEGISDDLEKQKEENRHQHEQIVSLKAKLKDTEEKHEKLLLESEDLTTLLNITRENQNKLALELMEFKERYEEVVNLLQDAQEQLKKQRKKSMPSVRGGFFSSLNVPGSNLPVDNLASELESSLYSELSLDSGISTDRLPSYKKVFETVKYASRNASSSRSSPVASAFNKATIIQPSVVTSSASAPRMSAFASYPQKNVDPNRRDIGSTLVYSSFNVQRLDSVCPSDTESVASDDITYPNGPVTGVPGVPGSTEIADALNRLTPADVTARRAALGNDAPLCRGYSEYDATIVPLGCRTPDSIMSTGSSGYVGHNYWRLPNKLQIVKPMEGSLTLYHWSQLATPTLSGLLEDRPGVQTKGGKTLEDLGFEMYTLSDLEEDEEYVNPGKSFQNSSSVYTYTNSTVLHPDDNTSVTHSLVGSKVCTGATNSRQSTAPPTPRVLSRRNSCSTFSTTYSLAKLLNERGIEAATASAFNTPSCEKSFTPTATPANSPDGSPVHSRSPSPTPFNPLKLPGFLSSGAELLRRTFISDSPPRSPQRSRRNKLALSRSERKALSGIRLVEKIESIGLETIIASTSGGILQPALPGALYTRRGLPSPMAQLTSLKGTLSSPSIDGNLSELGKQGSCGQRDLGVPGRPGTGALASQQQQQRQAGKLRPDLGTVSTTVSSSGEQSSGPLGTLSSMLFGRKGGLL